MERFEFENWPQFRAWVEDYSERHILCPTYWRGQKKPIWPLASRFERIILEGFGGREIPGLPRPSMIYPYGGRYDRPGGKKLWEPGALQKLRDRYLWVFKRAAAGSNGNGALAAGQDANEQTPELSSYRSDRIDQ